MTEFSWYILSTYIREAYQKAKRLLEVDVYARYQDATFSRERWQDIVGGALERRRMNTH